MKLVVFLSTLVCICAVRVSVPGLGTILGTKTLSAWTQRTIFAFKGIKFALSPSGNRRFMPPVPEEPWDNIYNASSSGRNCPQFLKKIVESTHEDVEDCLFLNVFTPFIPDSTNKTLLPVMVYIHGGGFYEGSARSFPPNYLLENDVILVVLQYRLGPLGFMSLHTDGLAGNVGLMDQVLGLKWVKNHIKTFGGNNNRITLFGHSAGAASISFMLLSPMVDESLFQKAILQSGSALSSLIFENNPMVFTKALFKKLTNITQPVDDSTIETYFKNATVNDLQRALQDLIANDPSMVSSIGRPVIQKAGIVKFIDGYPDEIINQGKIRTLPIMLGVTKHDGSYVTTSLFDTLESKQLLTNDIYLRNNFIPYLLKKLGVVDETGALSHIIQNKYFQKLFEREEDTNFINMIPGVIDICGMLYFKAHALKHAKINAWSNEPTFLYTFDYKGEHTRFGYDTNTSKYPFDGGIHHSNELLYLFPYHYKTPLNEDDLRIAKTMVYLWTNFAINGFPSAQDSDIWSPVKPGKNGPYYHINSTCYKDEDFGSEYKTI